MAKREQGQRQSGLSRDGLTSAALDLLGEGGANALSMRSLADRLGVKAASIYWHVRDRGELLDLVADAVLREARPVPPSGDWRDASLRSCRTLADVLASRPGVARVILENPDALLRSDLHEGLTDQLRQAGLPEVEARETSTMALVHVVAGAVGPPKRTPGPIGQPASVSIDAASRGVALTAGHGFEDLVRVGRRGTAAASASVTGRTVVVRRRLGVGRAEVELSDRYSWRVRVQAPTWNTVLDLAGLDVREIHLDGGATRVDCTLPPPHGVVPIQVSGGVVGLAIHRPAGVAVAARISAGALRVRLDGFSLASAITDARWETPGATGLDDRYELRISGGAVQVELDERPTARATGVTPEAARTDSADAGPGGGVEVALEVLLDGVEARLARSRS